MYSGEVGRSGLLEVIDASVAYGGEPVFSGVSLTVAPGEIVALIGGNGCGKSTLGRVMCATMLACSGSVMVDGHDPSDSEMERLRVRELVGYLQQDPRDQIVSSLVFDEVAFGPRNLALDEAVVAERVRDALDAVSLSGFEQRITTELSGGEQQRLALAGVLAMRPRYLVLDEPTSALDPDAREVLRSLFERLARQAGIGIALITHDESEIALADRVVDCESFRSKGRENAAPGHAVRDGALCADGPVRRQVFCEGPVLELDHVAFSHGSRRVLVVASLSVDAGEVVLLVGRSGAGKSTLASIAAGLVRPDDGAVRVCGAEAEPGSVAIAFQQPEEQFFLDSVYDEIAYAPRCAGLGEDEVGERVHSAARGLGIDEALLDRSPFELSGGQARRVALASVVSLDAPAVIFDEPSAALDADGRAFVHDLAVTLAREGRAVLVITHDVDEWRPFAHGVIALEGGALRQEASRDLDGAFPECGEGGCSISRHTGSQGPSAPFGGYVASSPLAGIDARVKIVLLLAATAGLFTASAPWTWAFWALCLTAALAAAKMRLSDVLRGIRPVSIILAFTLIANLVSCDGGAGIKIAGPVGLDVAGGLRGLGAVARIVMLVGFSLAVSTSTTATQISDAAVRLLRPLARLGAPVAALGTVLSLALRFIPMVSEEIGRIRLAQRARGARFDEGGMPARIRAWGSVLTPLMVGLFRWSDRLAESMAARCYDASAIGRMPAPRRLRGGDLAVLMVGLLALAIPIAASLLGLGR